MMNLVKLEDSISKDVEIMVGGHFFVGRIIEADPATNSILFEEQDGETTSTLVIDADSVQLLKVQ